MQSPVTRLLRQAVRREGEKLNILTFPTHERYQEGLANTGHNFYLWQGRGIKDWNSTFAPLPKNHVLLNPSFGDGQLPIDVEIDLVLSQNKFGQFDIAKKLAGIMNVPLISLEHTLPLPGREHDVAIMRRMAGHKNIFISEYSRGLWGWKEQDANVIHHGIDTDKFFPTTNEREKVILSVVNDWINRDVFCGFQIWQRVSQGMPVKVIGDTPGLSKPAANHQELLSAYQNSRIFLNTSTVSPVPTALMEAMSCLPEGEWIFFNYKASKIEDVINLQTLNENTRGDRILRKHIVDYNGEIVSIKARHIPKFRLTENHPVATVNISEIYEKSLKKTGKKPYIKNIGSIVYKNAADLKIGDYLVIPKLKKEIKVGMSKQWLRFYGLFLAEGNVGQSKGSTGNITITLNSKESNLIQEIVDFANLLNRQVRVEPLKDEQAVRVTFTHKELAIQLNNMFGHMSHNKRIPDELMLASKEEVVYFLEGYFDGDGHIIDQNSSSCASTSEELIKQLFLLFTKLDILPSYSVCKGSIRCIRGRTFQGRDRHTLSYTVKHDKSKKLYIEDENNFYVKINDISKLHYIGKVYNLSTESNTFTSPFALTHNCGCVVVSTATCMIPEIIKNGENGFISNNESHLRLYLEEVLNNDKLAKKIGEAARQTILDRFPMSKFVNKWNKLFYDTASET